MKTVKKCGILEIGNLEELPEDGPGVKVRTNEGEEIVIPLSVEEVRSIGTESLLFRNVLLTITIEAES